MAVSQSPPTHNKKRLHELLQDNQEPFLLHTYISDVRRQIIRSRPKPPPPAGGGNSSCFPFSLPTSGGDPRKSPLWKRSPITATPRTASFLLEAALRISRAGGSGGGGKSGIFGCLVKRLTANGGRKKKNNKGRRIGVKVNSVKDCSKLTPSRIETASSSADWTETDGDEFVSEMFEFASYGAGGDKVFCESPFRFVLHRGTNGDGGSRTPDFSSPAASPIRLTAEGNENNKESLKKCQVQKQQAEFDAAEEEEEKEQCSPVSVLDPPFDDDEEDYDDRTVENDGSDHLDGSSFAFVHKAKQQLLQKLRRFEKLAELDPVVLEKRMLDNDQEGGSESEKKSYIDELVIEELSKSIDFQYCSRGKMVPQDIKRLVSDLVSEEGKHDQQEEEEEDVVVKRVCKRFESWKEVESNTIDMMVEQDFVKSQGEWGRKQDEVADVAFEIEGSIFGSLVEELCNELRSKGWPMGLK